MFRPKIQLVEQVFLLNLSNSRTSDQVVQVDYIKTIGRIPQELDLWVDKSLNACDI